MNLRNVTVEEGDLSGHTYLQPPFVEDGMQLSRRGLLSRGAILAGAGLGGCLSGGSNVRYPSTETTAAGENEPSAAAVQEATTSAPEDVDQDGDAEEVPVPHGKLGGEVARIYDEVAWFANTHPEAMEAYRKGVKQAANRVAGLRRRDGFGDAEMEELTRAVTEATSVASTRIGDHFRIDEQVIRETDHHVSVVERFANRGDLDRIDEELDRLESYLRGVATEEFVRHEMSRKPIRNRLHGWLRRDWTRPLAFGVETSETRRGFDTLVYGNRNVLTSPTALPSDVTGKITGVFGPVSRSEGRIGRLTLIPIELPRPPEDIRDEPPQEVDWVPPDPSERIDEFVRRHRQASLEDLTVTSIRIQRYGSVAAATRAREALLESGPVEEELSYRFGEEGEKWRRIYYDYDGDVWYAYLIQAGPFLLTTGASQTSWEERFQWEEPLRRTWLWRPAVESDDESGDAAEAGS